MTVVILSAVVLLIQPVNMFNVAPVMPLYLGPETIMPIASILAAIVGVVLMFWRLVVRAIKNVVAPIRGAEPESDEAPLTAVDLPDEAETEGPAA